MTVVRLHALFVPILAALALPACFGTGVVPGTLRAAESAGPDPDGSLPAPDPRPDTVRLNDVWLVPPAPATASLSLRNLGRDDVTVAHLAIDTNANLRLDTSSCAGYPRLAAQTACSVTVTADGSARPGRYAVSLAYVGPQGHGCTHGQAVVQSGPLVLNDGAPVALDANQMVASVSVRNAGFDVGPLEASLPWSGTCAGRPSLNFDASACHSPLDSGQTCLLKLSTFGAEPGASTALTVQANAGDSVLAATQPVQIGSLALEISDFGAPGTQSLTLINLATLPIYVRDVRIGGSRSGNFVPPSEASLAPCRPLFGRCTVPVTVPADAWAAGNRASVAVAYVAAGVAQGAETSFALAPARVKVNNGAALVLRAGMAPLTLPLHNVGPFAWVSPQLAFSPPLPGVTVTTDCPPSLAPGADCNATVSVGVGLSSAAQVSLVAAGANAATDVAPTVTVPPEQDVLLLGRDPNGNVALVASTDGGNNWAFGTSMEPSFAPARAALTAAAWVVVGSGPAGPDVLYSLDRGTTWTPAGVATSAPYQYQGMLTAVAAVPGGFVAVGTSVPGALATRSSDGVHWTPLAFVEGVDALAALACERNDCVAVGSGNSLVNNVALHSNDGGNSWLPQPSDRVGPVFGGQLWGAAGAGNVFVLVGSEAQGPVVTTSVTGPAGPYALGATSGQGSLADVAGNANGWLAVGNDGQVPSQATVATCTDPSGAPFAASMGAVAAGAFEGVAWIGHAWAAVGNDGAGNGLLARSADGSSWSSATVAGTAELNGIAVSR